ncbi:MAG: Rid family detoxifying hydrolase [Balneolaceae bacterium]
MEREIIRTSRAPKAIGAYSQAVRVGQWVWCSGQIGLTPDTMQLVEGLEGQTRQVLDNLNAVLVEAGSSIEHLLRVRIYLTEMVHFDTVNRIYEEWVGTIPPARETVAVRELPKSALVEISCEALADVD